MDREARRNRGDQGRPKARLGQQDHQRFNTTDVPLEFGLLTAEVGEAFTAWRKHLPDFGEELADVAIYLMSLAEMNGIDLDTEIERKITKNTTRVYERDARGVPTRVAEGTGMPGDI